MSELRIDPSIHSTHPLFANDKESQEKGAVAVATTMMTGYSPTPPYTVPSLQIAEVAPAKLGFLNRVLGKIADFITPEADEIHIVDQNTPQGIQSDYIRPELDKPSFYAANTLTTLVAKAVDTGSKPITEAELERLILAANRAQVNNYAEEVRNGMDDTLQRVRENETLKDKYLQLSQEAYEKQKISTIFNWTSIATGVVGGALAIGGVVAAVASGGTAIPIVLGVGAAVAAISGGATQIAGGIFKYQGDKHQGDAIRTREERTMNKDAIQVALQDVQTKENTMTELWGNARRIVSNKPDVFNGSDAG